MRDIHFHHARREFPLSIGMWSNPLAGPSRWASVGVARSRTTLHRPDRSSIARRGGYAAVELRPHGDPRLV